MKRLFQATALLIVWNLASQSVEIPPDFRQHTLTNYNSSFFNPVFSLDRNNPQSVALWTRWQWQTIDGDPTTIVLNYTRRINPKSAAALGFFQHNTGLFLQRGGVLNYALSIYNENDQEFTLGANLFLFQSELADDRLIEDPDDIILPIAPDTNDFLLQFAPGVQFRSALFRIGVTIENLLDFSFSGSDDFTSGDGVYFLAHSSYEFPVSIFGFGDDEAYVRPMVYYKTIPNLDNQIGINALLSTPKVWIQGGYNSFYGISGGVGGKFFKKFSIGVLVESGTNSDLDGFDPTYELVAAFDISPQEKKQQLEPEEEEPEEEEELITEEQLREQELAKEAELARQAELEQQLEQERLAKEAEIARQVELEKQREENRLAEEARMAREQFIRDSVETIRIAEADAARKLAEESRIARERFVRDSVEAVRVAEAEAAKKLLEEQETAERDKPKEGERYQEVATEDGLQPGFYLVANVFGTKRYYESFMKTLTDRGLEPKSFYRSVNKYNYVYLKRYDSMQEARNARDSQYNGRYKDETWIFRVVGN